MMPESGQSICHDGSAHAKHAVQPDVSVITAALNASATIQANLESVRSQTTVRCQHIVIDGGSTDGTVEIIRSYANHYPLEWISEPDRGIADAMNKGFRMARGRYVLVLHADDRVCAPTSIKKALAYLDQTNADIYAAPVWMVFEDGRCTLLKPYRPLWWYHFKTPFRHQGTLVRRRFFKDVGLFDSTYAIAMDYDFFYRALKVKPRISYAREPLAVMGAGGIGSRVDMTLDRLDEEFQVQERNETNHFWRVMQCLFRNLYRPYKRRRVASAMPRESRKHLR